MGGAIEEVQGYSMEHESVAHSWRTYNTAGMFQSCAEETQTDVNKIIRQPPPPAEQLCSTEPGHDGVF